MLQLEVSKIPCSWSNEVFVLSAKVSGMSVLDILLHNKSIEQDKQ